MHQLFNYQTPKKDLYQTPQLTIDNVLRIKHLFVHKQGCSTLLYGIAGKQGKILNKKYFVINYNNQWKILYRVAYKLDTLDLKGKIIRQGRFQPDSALPIVFCAEPIDYEHSGYDRGHMAPAGDFKLSPDVMKTTFLLSNIAPRTLALNRKIWERLEAEFEDEY